MEKNSNGMFRAPTTGTPVHGGATRTSTKTISKQSFTNPTTSYVRPYQTENNLLFPDRDMEDLLFNVN
jgi:hypothetical protein